jgi:TolB protein
MPPQWRKLAPDQTSRLWTYDTKSKTRRLVHETADTVIEAPNWTPDGSTMIFNSDGLLYRVSVEGGHPQLVDTGTVQAINNDHVLAPGGKSVYVSNGDGHLYEIYLDGTPPRRVSNDHEESFVYFLHGVSPDGELLVYTGAQAVGSKRFGALNIFTIPAVGGVDVQLTSGAKPDDGAEFSPDGEWIYYNSETYSTEAGHAQICRMRPDGSESEQLTVDDRVNWFPHLSPDGTRFVYLSFPPGVIGHPADKDIILREMDPDGGASTDLLHLYGGQGTINVNSWAPDNARFAFVDYARGLM